MGSGVDHECRQMSSGPVFLCKLGLIKYASRALVPSPSLISRLNQHIVLRQLGAALTRGADEKLPS